jgi:predicted site-specific integrase-resolvase
MTINHLSQLALARRWAISPRTLERWRWTGEGPRYIKLVGRIVYRLEDVETFENARMHDSTSRPVAAGAPLPLAQVRQ